MSEAILEVLTVHEATARYNALVAKVGDLETFKEKGRRFQLDADDAADYDEIIGLEWMLDQDWDDAA